MAKRVKANKSEFSNEEITKAAQEITGRAPSKSFSIADAKQPAKEREPGLTAKGRVKFTTMLKPELREHLQNIADNKAISVADVLETIIEEYLGIKEI